MSLKAIVFDAYGTIFDVLSIATLGDRLFPGKGVELSALWRVKQVDYARIRTLSDRYESFSKVTRDALTYTLHAMDLAPDEATVEALMAEYDRLAVFEDSADALLALKASGLPLAILSNGDPPMLEAVVSNNRLGGVFDHLLSVESVGRFKTAPEAYELGPKAFGCAVDEILFVSSNGWDACGAAWYGYCSFWVNRAGMPLEQLGVSPAATGRDMHDVVGYVRARIASR